MCHLCVILLAIILSLDDNVNYKEKEMKAIIPTVIEEALTLSEEDREYLLHDIETIFLQKSFAADYNYQVFPPKTIKNREQLRYLVEIILSLKPYEIKQIRAALILFSLNKISRDEVCDFVKDVLDA